MIIFVWRMCRIGVEAKAHQYRLNAQHLLESGYDRDAAAATGWDRFYTISGFVGFAGSPVSSRISWGYIRITAVVFGYFNSNIIGSDGLEMTGKKLRNFTGLLVWHKTHADFCKCFGREYGF